MERSYEFSQKLTSTRRLPQRTPQERQEKREQARNLRMEAMLNNAYCAILLTDSLELEPALTAEDLKTILDDSQAIIHPDAVEDFINRLIDTCNYVKTRLKEDYPNLTSDEIALTVFNMLCRKDALQEKPHGRVKCDTSYPLAFILEIEKQEDFEQVEQRTNVGGLYNADSIHKFPVIAIKGLLSENTMSRVVLEHEKGHAEQNEYQEALKNANRKVVWARFEDSKAIIERSNKLLMMEAAAEDIKKCKMFVSEEKRERYF